MSVHHGLEGDGLTPSANAGYRHGLSALRAADQNRRDSPKICHIDLYDIGRDSSCNPRINCVTSSLKNAHGDGTHQWVTGNHCKFFTDELWPHCRGWRIGARNEPTTHSALFRLLCHLMPYRLVGVRNFANRTYRSDQIWSSVAM